MRSFCSSVFVASLLTTTVTLPVSRVFAQDVIRYEVQPLVAQKSFLVRMEIPKVRDLTVRLQIPVWSPGAYRVGNYAANLKDITATDSKGNPLRVFHPEPNTWDVGANGAQTIRVSYTVQNADMESADGVAKRAHLTGPRTYLYVVGRKTEPVELSLVPAPGAKVWKIAVGLEAAKGSKSSPQDEAASGKFRYTASSYDVLADAPVEMGDFAEDSFVAGGKRHQVVLYGNYANIDRAKLVEICKRVAENQTAFFGDAPYPHYVFMFRAAGGNRGGAGGLEHLSSTEISIQGTVNDAVRSVIAHEYFHLWNVKRIRPFVLGPFDYVSPPRTANLWWSEGVTSYYGDLLSRRADLNTDEQYLTHLGNVISQQQNNPARLVVSADEASMRVWEGGFGFGGISYYTKGELIGLCLDLEIRKRTGNRKSLDDVMKSLYEQVKRGNGPGFGEDDIKVTINKVCGQDLSGFYDTLARSVEEMPLAQCLAYAGLSLGQAGEPRVLADTGMATALDRETQTTRVLTTTNGGAAANAGVQAGDRIVAVNGQFEPQQIRQQLSAAEPGAKITLTLQSSGQNKDVELTVGSRTVAVWQITVDPSATPEQTELRRKWLTGK